MKNLQRKNKSEGLLWTLTNGQEYLSHGLSSTLRIEISQLEALSTCQFCGSTQLPNLKASEVRAISLPSQSHLGCGHRSYRCRGTSSCLSRCRSKTHEAATHLALYLEMCTKHVQEFVCVCACVCVSGMQ